MPFEHEVRAYVSVDDFVKYDSENAARISFNDIPTQVFGRRDDVREHIKHVMQEAALPWLRAAMILDLPPDPKNYLIELQDPGRWLHASMKQQVGDVASAGD